MSDSKSDSSPAPSIDNTAPPMSDNDENEFSPAIVIDSGSFLMKVGFSEDRAPYCVFPPVIGQVRSQHRRNASRDVYIGWQRKATHKLHQRRPMHSGISDSYELAWDDVETLWTHALKREARVNPEEHAVLLTEAPRNSKMNREKMAQIMFESLDVPAMCVRNTAVLSCLATGRTTGVVIESGHSATYTVPVYEGYALSQGIRQLNVAGRHLTQQLLDLLKNRIVHEGHGHRRCFDLPTEDSPILRALQRFKEKHAYVAADYDAEELHFDDSNIVDFELPDGNVMELGAERIQCVEPLFNPSLLLSRRSQKLGIVEMVYHSVWRCHHDLRREMWMNVVLGGGTMTLPGIEARLANALRPSAHRVRVIAHCRKAREYSAFVGGCVLASRSDFESDLCVTKDEYDDVGPKIVQRMCF